MKYRPKFKEPKNKEEKLICELVKMLHETVFAYINLNKANCKDNEIFITIRDAAMGFAGQTIDALVNIMVDDSQKMAFLKECQDILSNYIQQTSERI